jgi:hypothetical protein
MRTSRRFQPTLYGLPGRIAPSTVAAVAAVVSAPAATVADSDMPQSGIGSEMILAPPPSSSPATLNC